jgi:hypothetical protein
MSRGARAGPATRQLGQTRGMTLIACGRRSGAAWSGSVNSESMPTVRRSVAGSRLSACSAAACWPAAGPTACRVAAVGEIVANLQTFAARLLVHSLLASEAPQARVVRRPGRHDGRASCRCARPMRVPSRFIIARRAGRRHRPADGYRARRRTSRQGDPRPDPGPPPAEPAFRPSRPRGIQRPGRSLAPPSMRTGPAAASRAWAAASAVGGDQCGGMDSPVRLAD